MGGQQYLQVHEGAHDAVPHVQLLRHALRQQGHLAALPASTTQQLKHCLV